MGQSDGGFCETVDREATRRLGRREDGPAASGSRGPAEAVTEEAGPGGRSGFASACPAAGRRARRAGGPGGVRAGRGASCRPGQGQGQGQGSPRGGNAGPRAPQPLRAAPGSSLLGTAARGVWRPVTGHEHDACRLGWRIIVVNGTWVSPSCRMFVRKFPQAAEVRGPAPLSRGTGVRAFPPLRDHRTDRDPPT